MPKVFQKKIIKPGVYNVGGTEVSITPGDISKMVATHNQMVADGLLVPAPYNHDEKAVPLRTAMSKSDSDAFNNGGFWRKTWVDDQGWMVGQLEAATDEDAKAIGNKVKGVSLCRMSEWTEGNGKKYQDAMTHIALTNKPVVTETLNDSFLSMAQMFSVDAYERDLDEDGERATTVSLESALDVLADLGLELPDDTTPENFLERLCVAGRAVAAHKEKTSEEMDDDLTKVPKGAEQKKPAPIAMSKELEFAVKLLNDNGVTNPDTKKPFTPTELKLAVDAAQPATVQLSAEQQAAVNFAKNTAGQAYKQRIEFAVKSGRISKEFAESKMQPLLSETMTKLEFSADGKPVAPQLESMLEVIESLPENALLSGANISKPGFDQWKLSLEDVPKSGPDMDEKTLEEAGDYLATLV